MTYHFVLPIVPRAQKRDRIASIGGHARSYKCAEQSHYEAKIRALLAGDAPDKPIEGAVKVKMWCLLPIPASWSKKKRVEAIIDNIQAISKPDIDNAVKNIFDCMNGLIWKDDKQVVELWVKKTYSIDPRWDITVEEV